MKYKDEKYYYKMKDHIAEQRWDELREEIEQAEEALSLLYRERVLLSRRVQRIDGWSFQRMADDYGTTAATMYRIARGHLKEKYGTSRIAPAPE